MRFKKAFTLIELLVVIAIIALLLAILMPSLQMVKAKAQEVVCRSHLKSFGQVAAVYAYENNGQFVRCHAKKAPGKGSYAVFTRNTTNAGWLGAGIFFKKGYLEEPKLFYCPGNTNKKLRYGKYDPNAGGKTGAWPLGTIPESLPAGQDIVQITYHYRSLWDGKDWRAVNSNKDSGGMSFMADMFSNPAMGVQWHHKDSYNVVYIDGHSQAIVDKKQKVRDFNLSANGRPKAYNAGPEGYSKQDKVWKRFFDLTSGR